jgi:hypothetical protein
MLFIERLRHLLPWKRAEPEQSLEEELRFHQEMAQVDAINTVRVKEEARDVWTFGTLERLVQDLRCTMRSLSRAKSFTAVAVLSLALGCAAATAIFSLVNGIVLKSLGYRDPGKLVFIRQIICRCGICIRPCPSICSTSFTGGVTRGRSNRWRSSNRAK